MGARIALLALVVVSASSVSGIRADEASNSARDERAADALMKRLFARGFILDDAHLLKGYADNPARIEAEIEKATTPYLVLGRVQRIEHADRHPFAVFLSPRDVLGGVELVCETANRAAVARLHRGGLVMVSGTLHRPGKNRIRMSGCNVESVLDEDPSWVGASAALCAAEGPWAEPASAVPLADAARLALQGRSPLACSNPLVTLIAECAYRDLLQKWSPLLISCTQRSEVVRLRNSVRSLNGETVDLQVERPSADLLRAATSPSLPREEP